MKKLTDDEMRLIANAAGWQPISGFQATSYRYVTPEGHYKKELPNYNEDKNSLMEDIKRIQERIARLNKLETIALQALI